ncbi:c-type cytochrome [Psychrobacter sp. AOP22-C1-22]|uniref:c-type cytochrome n=1 Tax=unclassified Psychrobacter TaxID=196806 RepID=UPI00178884DB|nr:MULTISPECIES: c-type cytochrome [unclassified Psychrobacter]MDN5802705.1 c-type cytochrome [Psychrobacter sp.]MBE0407584.1 cytochrome c5 family protein [Psychrobacter sp. FME6]MBE0445856.1 cytochrome c5 family protein [Psychrobacter sp. FME5]MDN5891208.1 c-type cytochrome [Psychrobacter sp.]MDN5897920.1 c-type cytochrome [Psychrobacter sp.]
MSSITTLFSQTYRMMIGGGTALLLALFLNSAMISSAGAANIATTYDNSCATCHDSGALNAIKKGDSAKWQQLIKQKGMPALIKSVKGGMIQMPAGGLCDNCSDDDYGKLIEYMSK